MIKRTFDALAAAAGLIVSAPVIAVLAIAIRRDSPGPAIFRQKRVGRNGKPFVCLKLRTMRFDTPEGPTHDTSASRITVLGRRLRAWKLDELPQLWNVLVGEMSLVGPRPCLVSQTVLIDERRRRGVLALRPGITGPAQIRGIDMSDPVALAAVDALYIERQKLRYDFTIIARTFSRAALADRACE